MGPSKGQKESRKSTDKSAQKVVIAGDLLVELDREAEHYLPAAKLSRVQMVAVALREWLDGRRQQREGKPSKSK